MPIPYTRSSGEVVDAEEMHLAHLGSAVRKMERMDPDNLELPALQGCFARRQAQWELEHPEDSRG